MAFIEVQRGSDPNACISNRSFQSVSAADHAYYESRDAESMQAYAEVHGDLCGAYPFFTEANSKLEKRQTRKRSKRMTEGRERRAPVPMLMRWCGQRELEAASTFRHGTRSLHRPTPVGTRSRERWCPWSLKEIIFSGAPDARSCACAACGVICTICTCDVRRIKDWKCSPKVA